MRYTMRGKLLTFCRFLLPVGYCEASDTLPLAIRDKYRCRNSNLFQDVTSTGCEEAYFDLVPVVLPRCTQIWYSVVQFA